MNGGSCWRSTDSRAQLQCIEAKGELVHKMCGKKTFGTTYLIGPRLISSAPGSSSANTRFWRGEGKRGRAD
jgi:hypothetical protein